MNLAIWIIVGSVLALVLYEGLKRIPYIRRVVQPKVTARPVPQRDISESLSRMDECIDRLAAGSKLAKGVK